MVSSKATIIAPGGRDLGDFGDFWRAGDIHSSTSTPKYCDEPYGDLGMSVNKVLSAWTEVSIAP